MNPVFRNPDKFQVLPFREWIRNNLPNGRSGFIVEDLDLIIRVYGFMYQTDDTGKFMLIELKFGTSQIGYAQKRTFKLIHDLLRLADKNGDRYRGYFVIQYDDEDWDKANFRVNHWPITKEQLIEFLQFKDVISINDFP